MTATTTPRMFTSKPRSLAAARQFRDSLLNHQVHGVPPRLWPAVIPAETDGYHVVETGFALSNGFEIVK
jgi:hypothetical protein